MRRGYDLVLLAVLGAARATDAKVVDSFNECRDVFFCLGAEPLVFNGTGLARICQRLHGRDHFATLYHTGLRIPLYSAYRAGSGDATGDRRPVDFFIEPQLDLLNGGDEMIKEPLEGVGFKQALNADYKRQGYDRGHLFPFSFNPGSGTASCTLTNVVPMLNKRNKQWFHQVEAIVKKKKCKAEGNLFVITGVIPSNKFTNERVNIPFEVFTFSICCEADEEEEGEILWMDLKNGNVTRELITQAALQEWVHKRISKRNRKEDYSFNSQVKEWVFNGLTSFPALIFKAVTAVVYLPVASFNLVAWIIYSLCNAIGHLIWALVSTVFLFIANVITFFLNSILFLTYILSIPGRLVIWVVSTLFQVIFYLFFPLCLIVFGYKVLNCASLKKFAHICFSFLVGSLSIETCCIATFAVIFIAISSLYFSVIYELLINISFIILTVVVIGIVTAIANGQNLNSLSEEGNPNPNSPSPDRGTVVKKIGEKENPVRFWLMVSDAILNIPAIKPFKNIIVSQFHHLHRIWSQDEAIHARSSKTASSFKKRNSTNLDLTRKSSINPSSDPTPSSDPAPSAPTRNKDADHPTIRRKRHRPLPNLLQPQHDPTTDHLEPLPPPSAFHRDHVLHDVLIQLKQYLTSESAKGMPSNRCPRCGGFHF